MTYRLQLQLLILRNEKRNLIEQCCGGSFLHQVDQSFDGIERFDVLAGMHPLEGEARERMIHASGIVLLEQRIKKIQREIGATFSDDSKEVIRRELKTELCEKYGVEFVGSIEREFRDILEFNELEGQHPLEQEAQKILEQQNWFLGYPRVTAEQNNFDPDAKSQWEDYILRLIDKDKKAEVVIFPGQDVASAEYVPS